MKRKYPDLIKYRKENESWKSLFVRMVYYIARLKEEYKIPYFPGLNIVELFSNKYANPFFLITKHAAKAGNLEIIKMLHIGPDSILFDEALHVAVKNRHLEVVKELVRLDPKVSLMAASTAAEYGSLDILKYIVENKFFVHLNALLLLASENNQKEIAEYLISQGANDFEPAIYYARISGHDDMINYLQNFI